MEMHRQDEVCGNCGGDAIFAIRVNSPKEMSLWNLPLIPTGVRIDAWLCRKCLEETVPREEVNVRLLPHGPTHNSAVQKEVARKRKEKRHASL
jgi:hypothetical protein